MIEHEQYYRKGGTYELPIEIYNDLIEQIKEAQKERNEYKQLYENALKINQNENKYRTELEDKYVVLQQENERLKEIIKDNTILVKDENGNYQECNINPLDYKSRCEGTINLIDRTIEIIKQQPTKDDSWILSRLYGFKYALNGSDENE